MFLLGDFYVSPEGYVVGEVLVEAFYGCGERFWISPSIVLAWVIAVANVEVLAYAFPGARIWGIALVQKFLFDTGRWEIPVTFYVNEICFFCFGYYFIVPYCFHDVYSVLRASIGSNFAAFLAGNRPANTATNMRAIIRMAI